MSDVDEYFLDLVRVLALSPEEQCACLEGETPDKTSRTAGEFPEGRNLLVDLARMILDVHPDELSGDDEVLGELLDVLMLLLSSNQPGFWSLSGLRSFSVWGLLRKLARAWLNSAGHECRLPGRSIQELLK